MPTTRGHGPVILVTNATTRLESDVDTLGIADHVDGIVSSARLGKAKPDPGIYLAAAGLRRLVGARGRV